VPACLPPPRAPRLEPRHQRLAAQGRPGRSGRGLQQRGVVPQQHAGAAGGVRVRRHQPPGAGGEVVGVAGGHLGRAVGQLVACVQGGGVGVSTEVGGLGGDRSGRRRDEGSVSEAEAGQVGGGLGGCPGAVRPAAAARRASVGRLPTSPDVDGHQGCRQQPQLRQLVVGDEPELLRQHPHLLGRLACGRQRAPARACSGAAGRSNGQARLAPLQRHQAPSVWPGSPLRARAGRSHMPAKKGASASLRCCCCLGRSPWPNSTWPYVMPSLSAASSLSTASLLTTSWNCSRCAQAEGAPAGRGSAPRRKAA
jgi:hypothetical protein